MTTALFILADTILLENSQKRNTPVIFYARGHCTFEDCSCKFKLEMRREDKATKRITVFL